MRNQIFIALFLISLTPAGAVNAGSLVIESAIYDLDVYESGFEGFCSLSVRAESDSDELYFPSPLDVDIKTEGLEFRRNDTGFQVSGLNLRGGDTKNILLRIKGNVSDNNLELPLLGLSYRIEKTIIAVRESNNKFVWRVDFPAYSSEENDDILISGDISEEAIKALNSDFIELRGYLSKQAKPSRYRIYLGEIEPGNEVIIKAWVGRSYQYYLPNMLGVIVLCVILFLALYFLLLRLHLICEKESVSHVEKATEKDVEWFEGMKQKWEATLKTLENDEKIIYGEIFGCDGEILQRKLPEKTGFSKAKVTRILDRLEQKNLVERRSYGVTNKVILK